MTPPAPILQVGVPAGQVNKVAAWVVVVNVPIVVALTERVVEGETERVVEGAEGVICAGGVLVVTDARVHAPVRFE